MTKRLAPAVVSLAAALALSACSTGAIASVPPAVAGRRLVGLARERSGRRGHRHQPRRIRHARRPSGRGDEGGRAQRHHPAPRLGRTTARSSPVQGEVPGDQDQRGITRRLERRRDRRRQVAQGPGHRARRLRRRADASRCQNLDVFTPYKVAELVRHPRLAARTRPACVPATTAATCRSATTRPRSPPHRRRSTTCSAPRTRARSRSTATPPRRTRLRRGRPGSGPVNGGIARRHPARHRLLQQAARRPATSTRSTPPRPRSPRARPRWSSTGTTSTRHRRRRTTRLEDRRPPRRRLRGVLQPGDQQGRAAPGRRTPVGGVPLQRPRPRTSGSKGGARPVRAQAMEKAGTLDETLWKALPAAPTTSLVPTAAQSKTAGTLLGRTWASAIG